MEASTSKIGTGIVVLTGILGIYLITNDKTAISHRVTKQISSLTKAEEAKQAEIIGDYLAHGIGGSVFQLPSGDVMKVVSLENQHAYHDKSEGGSLNREQAGFIESLWLKQLAGENAFSDDFVQIKHYHRGYAGPKMTQLVNSESPAYGKKPLKVGERIAYWVMEYVPTIGRGDMSEARIRGATERLNAWAGKHGYKIEDLHASNYGERDDGTFVAFDTWPTKID
tara:strand:- start:476 stop:1150 length:675 start_codon:yes stop_codon:yes gene_type:complete